MAGFMGHMNNSSCRVLGQTSSMPLPLVPRTRPHQLDAACIPMAPPTLFVSLSLPSTCPQGTNMYLLEMMKETPVALQYDATFEIIRFFCSCNNNEGLSNKDIDSLLSILWHQDFDTSSLVIYTSSDIKKYEEQLYIEEDVSKSLYMFASIYFLEVNYFFKI
jgi:hypothetical protein